ncbi:general secretion pathway protein GspK [Desulfobacter postgatei]|jgi:general secretion pathway protein K|uniref:general secretion pathway protein GspK n=1 Tax=Desulfobacter postgatei TaxID=2293 RepID=UPI002A372037|nr:general secretion pathway protein GspK [Desulfobacter postgatei]MDX9963320.1 general secretion pathway protein GspK [Desulfobacter postgatei]
MKLPWFYRYRARQVNSIYRNQKGMALIVTIAVVAILCVVALEAGRLAKQAASGTIAENDMFAAREMAMSGIHLAMMILAMDGADNEIDSIQEPWADPEQISLAVAAMGLNPENVSLKISDEMGKLQLNALLKQFPGNDFNDAQVVLLERFLTLAAPEDKSDGAGSAVEIVNALKDWLDSMDDDTITGLTGAESNYYESLDVPYTCANGPLRHISELFLVKGVVDAILSPSYISQGMDESIQADIKDMFTVYGLSEVHNSQENGFSFSGTVNINTAPVAVLAALLPEGRDLNAQDLADYRSEKASLGREYIHTLESGWFEDVIALNDNEKKAFEKLITYSSSVFRADCTAKKNGYQVALHAVIKREKQDMTGKWSCRILQMERG